MAKKQIFNYTFTPGGSGVGNVSFRSKVALRQLLLITNVTDGTIIYNFADPTKGGSVSYSATTNLTTLVFDTNTSSMSSSDELSILIETKDETFIPGENFADPVDKFRVSNPQSMIDTDFEYSLQPFKWETLELINNRPSVYNKANEPFLTADQIESITVEVASGGGAGQFVYNSSAGTDPGTTGLSVVSGWSGDDDSAVITLPWTISLNGVNYNYLWVHTNSFVSFLQSPSSPSYNSYRAANNIPGAVTWFVWSGNYPNTQDTRASSLYTGQRNYTGLGNCFVIDWNGNNQWFGSGVNRTWEMIFPQNDPGVIYLRVYTATTQGSNGYPTEQFMGLSDGAGNWTVAPTYSSTYGSATGEFIYGTGGIQSVQANVETVNAHGLSVGDPILIKESLNTAQIDGAYIISSVPTSTSFQVLADDPTDLQSSPASGTYSQISGNDYIQLTVSNHLYRVGSSVYIEFASHSALNGIYEVLPEPSPSTNIIYVSSPDTTARSGNLTITQNFRGSYTSIYSGGFFEGSSIPLATAGISEVNGSANANIQFKNPHGLFVGTPIYVIDNTQASADHIGGFTIVKVIDDFNVEYTTRSAAFTSSSQLSTGANAIVYIRPEGNATHRVYDGGVQITPSTNSPNAQIIRQTRKYFRYQSGKGVQFSTGILFMPTYDINNVTVTQFGGNTFLTITTEQEHGFIAPVTGRILSPTIKLSGFTVTTGTNIYNGTFTVNNVSDKKTFVVLISGTATDTRPGGDATVEVRDWYDATVRSGLFDEQNGIFFEHDGTDLWAVKRSATFQTRGTVSAVVGSPKIYGYQTNFQSSIIEGDYVNIRGLSHLVTKIISNTEMEVSPEYRGEENVSNVKMTKVVETRTPRSEFNLDKCDGTGPSGYEFDQNKMQMVYIDYSWYGAGKVRWGLRVSDGTIAYIHELPNNNTNTEAYMRSGNLPGRFEIQNKSKQTILTDQDQGAAQSVSWSYAGSFVYTLTITWSGHQLQVDDGIIISGSSDTDILPNGFYGVASVVNSNSFTINLENSDRDPFSGTATANLALWAGNSATFNLSVEDASDFAPTGVVQINNEYLRYSKTNNTTLQILQRNLFGRSQNASAVGGDTVISTNQNFAPALSHWGTSVIMDGRFDVDKSYLFTAINRSNINVAGGSTVPLVSVRLAPSVDYGVARGYGIRNLINRSLLTLQAVGVSAQRVFLITCKLNSESVSFTNQDNWIPAGNGSIAQYFDHSATTATGLSSGDTIFEFFADDGNNRFATTERTLEVVRELANSILGGNNVFPDGPDILTVYATNTSGQAGNIRGRVSWSESQG